MKKKIKRFQSDFQTNSSKIDYIFACLLTIHQFTQKSTSAGITINSFLKCSISFDLNKYCNLKKSPEDVFREKFYRKVKFWYVVSYVNRLKFFYEMAVDKAS